MGYIEMIYIDSDNQARHTNMSKPATKADFETHRTFEVASDATTFLLDFHDGKDNLVDTICLDHKGFTAITGHAPKSEAEYRQIDQKYWAEALAS